MTQTANNSSVRVVIFGRMHDVCSTDPNHVLELARRVDAEMRSVAKENPNMADSTDLTDLAVFAALNIAEKCYRLERKLDSPAPKPLTPEERQRIRERRAKHYTHAARIRNSFYSSQMANCT